MAQIGLVAASIGLIEKSIAAYRVIAAAKNFGSDAAESVMMLRFEAFRYQEWTHNNRTLREILESNKSAAKSTHTIAFLGTKKPISPVQTLCEALCDAVNQIVDIFDCVDKLLGKYNRAFESRKQSDYSIKEGVTLSAGGSGLALSQSKMHNAGQKYEQLKSSLQSQTPFARRVKYGMQTWNDADKDTLKELVQRFKYWNDNLYELAPPAKHRLQELGLSTYVVGSARSSAQLESVRGAAAQSNYEAVYRSAALKKKTGEMETNLSLEKGYENLVIDLKVAKSRRFITQYYPDGRNAISQRVLVEWYYYDPKWTESQVNLANDRVASLATRFSSTEKPANLPVLDCIGWVQHPQKADRALLYALSGSNYQNREPITLHELISGNHTSKGIRLPSLGDRLCLASALAVGVLELHTVEWLHKGLGSHNVLLFHDAAGNVDYGTPFISGFDFARPDRPKEESLSLRPSKFDIYRHPEIRVPKPNADAGKPSSSRMHDAYSLGLVLFEIGMWMPLESYIKANLSAEGFRKRICDYVERDLFVWMGNQYSDAVKSCLSGDYLLKSETFPLGVSEESDGESEESEESFAEEYTLTGAHQLAYFYQAIVAQIHSCQCGMSER